MNKSVTVATLLTSRRLYGVRHWYIYIYEYKITNV